MSWHGDKSVVLSKRSSKSLCLTPSHILDWTGVAVLPWSEESYDWIQPVAGLDDTEKFLRDALKEYYKKKANKYNYKRRTEIDETDDESYKYFNGSLPIC